MAVHEQPVPQDRRLHVLAVRIDLLAATRAEVGIYSPVATAVRLVRVAVMPDVRAMLTVRTTTLQPRRPTRRTTRSHGHDDTATRRRVISSAAQSSNNRNPSGFTGGEVACSRRWSTTSPSRMTMSW